MLIRCAYLKARRLVDVYENTIWLLCLIVMCEASKEQGGHLPSLLRSWKMERPSCGSYVAFLFDVIDGKWGGHFLPALRASDLPRLRKDCDDMTKCRNEEFGHSTVMRMHRASEVIQEFSSVLCRLLNAASFLRTFRLFLAQELRYDGNLFTATGRILQGSNLHHPHASIALNQDRAEYPLRRKYSFIQTGLGGFPQQMRRKI